MSHNTSSQLALAAHRMLEQVAELAARTEGVRKTKQREDVHQMRVASRRLRNALRSMKEELPKGRYRRWQHQIKRVTKALGAARDTDVQIIGVRKIVKDCKDDHDRRALPGLDRLLLRLKQQRKKQQNDVIDTVDRLESSGVLGDMREMLLSVEVDARIQDSDSRSRKRLEGAATAINRSLQEVLAYEPFVRAPEHVDELHRMRIAAKQLRYTLETYAPLYDNELTWQIKLARRVQGLLGDIHDADVWIVFLPKFLKAERRRHRRFFGHARGFTRIQRGIQHMLESQMQLRSDLHKQFVRMWDDAARSGRWDELGRSILPPESTELHPFPVNGDAADDDDTSHAHTA